MTSAPAPRDRAALVNLTGLDYMRAMLTGDIPPPPIWGLMNFALSEVVEGRVAFAASAQPQHGNVIGTVHGGWYGALLDAAMGCAVMTDVPAGATHTTLEYKVNIIRPVLIGLAVEAVGVVTHAGRSTGVSTGEIRGVEDGKLYATGSTTCIILAAR